MTCCVQACHLSSCVILRVSVAAVDSGRHPGERTACYGQSHKVHSVLSWSCLGLVSVLSRSWSCLLWTCAARQTLTSRSTSCRTRRRKWRPKFTAKRSTLSSTKRSSSRSATDQTSARLTPRTFLGPFTVTSEHIRFYLFFVFHFLFFSSVW